MCALHNYGMKLTFDKLFIYTEVSQRALQVHITLRCSELPKASIPNGQSQSGVLSFTGGAGCFRVQCSRLCVVMLPYKRWSVYLIAHHFLISNQTEVTVIQKCTAHPMDGSQNVPSGRCDGHWAATAVVVLAWFANPSTHILARSEPR